MKLAVGEIAARCPSCGANEFDTLSEPLGSHSELVCLACGTGTTYETLVTQIGEQAMKQANDALAKLRNRKND